MLKLLHKHIPSSCHSPHLPKSMRHPERVCPPNSTAGIALVRARGLSEGPPARMTACTLRLISSPVILSIFLRLRDRLREGRWGPGLGRPGSSAGPLALMLCVWEEGVAIRVKRDNTKIPLRTASQCLSAPSENMGIFEQQQHAISPISIIHCHMTIICLQLLCEQLIQHR